MVETRSFDWSGVYIGAHGGYLGVEASDNLGNPDSDFSGVVGGVHVGLNYQFGYFVVGVEADISATSAEEDQGPPLADIDIPWMSSIRARAGLAYDRFLLYGTGGYAVAQAELDSNVGNFSDDATLDGYVLGIGGEVMITENLIAGVEYLHYEFDDEAFTLNVPFRADGSADAVRARLSWKFNLF